MGLLVNKELKRIAILGSGWLGLPLTQYLAEKTYSVKTSTRSEIRAKQIREQNTEVLVFDIENLDTSDLSFLDTDILIINITSKNIKAFENLILVIEKSPVQKIIFVSSTSVYPNLNRVVSEDEGVELVDSKLFQIESIFRKNKHFQTTILRLSGLIGYLRHPGNWFATRPISQPNANVNLIHRDDCIGIIESIIKQNIWGEVFNGTADLHPTKRNYYFYCKGLVGKPMPTVIDNEVLHYKIICNRKVKQRLGYVFKYSDLYDIQFKL